MGFYPPEGFPVCKYTGAGISGATTAYEKINQSESM